MAKKSRFVSYLRVSSRAQGKSGLGIAAQRVAVANYLGNDMSKVIAEFTEVESGRRDARPALERALALARIHQAGLIVAKVDRLTRSVGFLSRLLEAGVDIRFADLPVVEGPTGRFMLQQMAAVAELEAGMISSRTKAALAAVKARGQRLGGFRGTAMSEDIRAAGRHAQMLLAERRALDLSPVFDELAQEGLRSPTEVARALTARGIPTIRERGAWSPHQVVRIQRRLVQARSAPTRTAHILETITGQAT